MSQANRQKAVATCGCHLLVSVMSVAVVVQDNRQAFYYSSISDNLLAIVLAMIQYFSLTTKQHQPAYKPQKLSNEQGKHSLLNYMLLCKIILVESRIR